MRPQNFGTNSAYYWKTKLYLHQGRSHPQKLPPPSL